MSSVSTHTPEDNALVQTDLSKIADPNTANQMRVPMALSHLFVTIMSDRA